MPPLILHVSYNLYFKENLSTVEQLREISRQHYLEKREEKELKLLEMGKFCVESQNLYFDANQVPFRESRECVVLLMALSSTRHRNHDE